MVDEPELKWSYNATIESSGQTRTYANVSAGSVGSVVGTYTIWNTSASHATNCSIYLEDVSGSFVSDTVISLSWGATAFTGWTSGHTLDFPDLSAGASETNEQVLEEKIDLDGGETVGTKQWKKVITYQYS